LHAVQNELVPFLSHCAGEHIKASRPEGALRGKVVIRNEKTPSFAKFVYLSLNLKIGCGVKIPPFAQLGSDIPLQGEALFDGSKRLGTFRIFSDFWERTCEVFKAHWTLACQCMSVCEHVLMRQCMLVDFLSLELDAFLPRRNESFDDNRRGRCNVKR
jgi:hypothetical protein